MEERKIKLGIYGGTFSPPHAGHVRAAEAFMREAALDKLLVMPVFISNLKAKSTISAEHRLAMAKLAFGELEGYGERVIVSDYEASRSEVSYTANTLQHFADDGVELFFLCGTDMLLSMGRWYQPEVIFSLATIAYMRREQSPEYDAPIAEAKARYERDYGARIIEVSCPPIKISSTELREKLSNGESTDGLLSPSVQAYIKEHRLYHE